MGASWVRRTITINIYKLPLAEHLTNFIVVIQNFGLRIWAAGVEESAVIEGPRTTVVKPLLYLDNQCWLAGAEIFTSD